MREREEVPGTESNGAKTPESGEADNEEAKRAYRDALRGKVRGGFIELQEKDGGHSVAVRPESIGTIRELFAPDGTYRHTEVNAHPGFVWVTNRREQVLELIEIAKEESSAQAAIDGEWKRIAADLDSVAHQVRHHLADLLFAADNQLAESELRQLTRRDRVLPAFLPGRVRGAVELLQDARRGHVLAKAEAERELQKCSTLALQAEERARLAEAGWRDACVLLQTLGQSLGIEAGTPGEEIVKAIFKGLARPLMDPSTVDSSSGLRKALGDAQQRHGELLTLGESLLYAMGFSRDELAAATQQGEDEHGGMVKLLSTMPTRLTELCEQSERMRGELQHRDGERAEMVRELGELRKEQTQLRAENVGLRERADNAEVDAVGLRRKLIEFRDKGIERELELGTLRQRLSVYEPGEVRA